MTSQLAVAQLGTATLASLSNNDSNILQTLSLTQSLIVTKDLHRNLNDSLSLIQSINLSNSKTLIQTLTLTQSVSYTRTSEPVLSHLLNLTQNVTISKDKDIILIDRLQLIQTVNKTGIFHQTIIQTLNLSSGHFDLFLGSTSGNSTTGTRITVPDVIVIRQKDYVTLQNNGLIVLPAPLFGDTQKNVAEIKINRSVNGKAYPYVKTTGRKHLRYTFGLKEQKASELQLFVDKNMAQFISLVNWKGEAWYVKIVNNPITYVADSRGFTCGNLEYYKVELEFEGYKLG